MFASSEFLRSVQDGEASKNTKQITIIVEI